MGDDQERLDKHAEKILGLDRRVTKHDAVLDTHGWRLDQDSRQLSELKAKIDHNHSETTRQLTLVCKSLGSVEGSLGTLRWGIPVAITGAGCIVAAGGLVGSMFGLW